MQIGYPQLPSKAEVAAGFFFEQTAAVVVLCFRVRLFQFFSLPSHKTRFSPLRTIQTEKGVQKEEKSGRPLSIQTCLSEGQKGMEVKDRGTQNRVFLLFSVEVDEKCDDQKTGVGW